MSEAKRGILLKRRNICISRLKVLVIKMKMILRCLQTFVYYQLLILISFSKAALRLRKKYCSLNKAEQSRKITTFSLTLASMCFSFLMAHQSPYQLPMEGKQAGGDHRQINWDNVEDKKQHPKSGLTWWSAKLLFLKCHFALCVCATPDASEWSINRCQLN